MIKVRVPASSANMGPGFDSIGIALSLYNIFGFEEIESGLKFNGFLEEFCNEENIVYKAMIKCFEKANYKQKGLRISILEQNIPVSRGLGSSSSCIVAGLIGANKIMGSIFSKEELLKMAVEMEGHADNVAPAMLGKMIVAIVDKGNVYYNMINVHEGIKFIPIIPDFKLSTSDARKVLPNKIDLKDGVYNVGRAALLVAAMNNGDISLLKYACQDSFHEKYRSKLIDNFEIVKNEALRLGAKATYLSGAGPTIMSISSDHEKLFIEKIKKFLRVKSLKWDVHELSVDSAGAIVIEGD